MTKPKQSPCLGCGAALSGRGGRRYCGPDCRPRCFVEGCSRPTHSKGLCSAHATRAARFGDPLAPKMRQRNEGTCSVAACVEPMRKRGWCAKHYAMWHTYGEIRPWFYSWGEGGYSSTHRALYRARGKAADFRCMDCDAPADEWSYDGDDPAEEVDEQGRRFTKNFEAYSPRCVRCHRIYDDNPIAKRSVMP